MAWSKPNTITSWSFSRLNDYDICPFRAKCKHVDKLKEPGSPAMDRGQAIHTLVEEYLTDSRKQGDLLVPAGRKVALPPELTKVKMRMANLKQFKPQVEQTWAFTKDWVRTSWNDWANCWLRIKTDIHYLTDRKKTLVIVDNKTGKDKSEEDGPNREQMRLYQIGGVLIYPDVTKVVAELLYVDHNKACASEIKVTPRLVAGEKKFWEQRTRAMLNDTIFAPRPGPHCRWCAFRKEAGGPCAY